MEQLEIKEKPRTSLRSSTLVPSTTPEIGYVEEWSTGPEWSTLLSRKGTGLWTVVGIGLG
jgi:hypothetical protein